MPIILSDWDYARFSLIEVYDRFRSFSNLSVRGITLLLDFLDLAVALRASTVEWTEPPSVLLRGLLVERGGNPGCLG